MPDGSSPTTTAPDRGAWKSKLGFILAASGSAIGLGNIVFFASNAYQYGGGAFYVPYFVALFAIGIPVMIMEFSLGTMTGRSFRKSHFRSGFGGPGIPATISIGRGRKGSQSSRRSIAGIGRLRR